MILRHSLIVFYMQADAQSASKKWLPPPKFPLLFIYLFMNIVLYVPGCVLVVSLSNSLPTPSLPAMRGKVGNRESCEALQILLSPNAGVLSTLF